MQKPGLLSPHLNGNPRCLNAAGFDFLVICNRHLMHRAMRMFSTTGTLVMTNLMVLWWSKSASEWMRRAWTKISSCTTTVQEARSSICSLGELGDLEGTVSDSRMSGIIPWSVLYPFESFHLLSLSRSLSVILASVLRHIQIMYGTDARDGSISVVQLK